MSCGASSIGAMSLRVVALQRDVEALILSAGAVIGEVERLLDQAVEVDARAARRWRRANAPACS